MCAYSECDTVVVRYYRGKIMHTFKDVMSEVQTENGALSNATVGGDAAGRIELFFKTVRAITPDRLHALLEASWAEDKLDTLKLIFNTRDSRGGKGERLIFVQAMQWLYAKSPETFSKNLRLVPEYGYWKDIVTLAETDVTALRLIAVQLVVDRPRMLAGEPISLAAKWAPSEGGSIDRKHKFAKTLAELMGVNMRTYRKQLSELRAYLNVVETYMCSGRWDGIEYQRVPSVAMNKLRKAFKKRDETRFAAYLELVKEGKAKINAGQLFPHDLVRTYLDTYSHEVDATVEAQWTAMVGKYRELGTLDGILPICDVSGSMSGTPMEVSVSLGLLLSELAPEPFKDAVITFSGKPAFHIVKGDTLRKRVSSLAQADWEMNTDLQAVFKLILSRALQHKLSPEQMPKTVVIISDMQFDQAARNTQSNLDAIKLAYSMAEYKLPNIAFWNVRANTSDFPATDESGMALLAGYSPAIFKAFLNAKDVNPYSVMREAIDSPRYAAIAL